MTRWLLSVGSAIVLVLPALAQQADPNDPLSTSPQDKVQTAAGRAPGVALRAAISRHSTIHAERLGGARSGENRPDPNSGGASSGSGDSSSGLGSLLDLANQFGGLSGLSGLGSTGLTGDVQNLLGGLTGSTGSTTTTPTDGPTGVDTTDPRLADLLALRDAAANEGSTLKASNRQKTAADLESLYGREFGGGIGRLTKPEPRGQLTDPNTLLPDTEERSFRNRLLDSWSSALFSALTLGFQTPQFIDLLENGLRPILRPIRAVDIQDFIDGLIQGITDGLTPGETPSDGDAPETPAPETPSPEAPASEPPTPDTPDSTL